MNNHKCFKDSKKTHFCNKNIANQEFLIDGLISHMTQCGRKVNKKNISIPLTRLNAHKCIFGFMIFLYVYWHGDFDTMQFWFYKVVFFLVNKKYYILYQVNCLNLFIGFFWTSTIYCITSEKPKIHLWAFNRVKGMEIFFLLTFLPHWDWMKLIFLWKLPRATGKHCTLYLTALNMYVFPSCLLNCLEGDIMNDSHQSI
jgi:hypothetical protein